MQKSALITGTTGQDGAYLARFLLDKGYDVHGTVRRSSLIKTDRVDAIYNHPNFHLHYADMTDSASLIRLVDEVRPHELYNLAAQSHVAVSFETPEYTANSDALGTLRLLEALRLLKLESHTRFYQASTSELYGKVQEVPQVETTPFYPRSPYAVAKLYAYWITVNYREAYDLYACNGILFNHESPMRGETFVTRKITQALGRIYYGLQDCLHLGNLDAKRDWGHAKDYVEMQWLMLQQETAEDFVIATGRQASIREFVEQSALHLGIELSWEGEGVSEKGVIRSISPLSDGSLPKSLAVGDTLVAVNPRYFRPTEVASLLGDAKKAKDKLGWTPKHSLEELIQEMQLADLQLAKEEAQRALSREVGVLGSQ